MRTACFIVCLAGLCVLCSPVRADGPAVTAKLFDGSTQAGEWLALGDQEIQLNIAGEVTSLPLDQLMQLDFGPGEVAAVEAGIAVTLADQSRLHVATLSSDGTTLTATSRTLGELRIPIRNVRDIRFSELTDELSAGWDDLRSRNARDDLLVIRKGEVLDYTPGSIGRIEENRIVMLIRERELAAPRDRVFGLIYSAREKPANRTWGLATRDGDLLQAWSASLKDGQLMIESASLGELAIPLEQVRSIDFGGGRVRFLSDLAFDSSRSQPPDGAHPIVWFVSKDAPAGSGGRSPLVIGNREYRRGLWLHSGAVVRYRLNREYSQFRAVAGFEQTHITRMPRFNPAVRLLLIGDGRELLNQEFRWDETPQPLEVDLKDVRDLEIRVESLGAQAGILEHFALGDAQVLQ